MPHGEGSRKQVDHYDSIFPLTADIDNFFHDFWTVVETIKKVISTHLEEVSCESRESRREVREI